VIWRFIITEALNARCLADFLFVDPSVHLGMKKNPTGLSVLLAAFSILLCAQLASSQSADDRDLRPVELQYDEGLSKLGFPNPLLRASAEGQTAWFIVDTGAGVHTFAKWFVKAAGLKALYTQATVTGSLGAESKVSVVHKASLHLQNEPREILIGDAIVADFPSVFEEQRIGGLISPQLLALRGKSVILDLNAPRLSFSATPRASSETKVCTNRDSQFANRLYAVEIPFSTARGWFVVDTGATSTVLNAWSNSASSLSQEASGGGRIEGVGGKAETLRKTKPLELQLPGVRRFVAISLGQPSVSCGADGLIGMDVLHGCLLDLGDSGFGWSCR
jgi:Aspartyl protease